MKKFYLIQRYDEDINEWVVQMGFAFDTFEEAEQSLYATYDYHNTPGHYRIIEIEKYREMTDLIVERRKEED